MDSIIPVWTLSANGEKEDTLNPLVRLASSGFHSHQKKNQLMNFIHSYFQTLNSQTLNQSTPVQLSKFKSLWINKIYIHSIWMNLKNIMLIKRIEYKKAQTPFMCGSWQKTYLMYCKRNHSTCRGRRCMCERGWWWWTVREKCFSSLKCLCWGRGYRMHPSGNV